MVRLTEIHRQQLPTSGRNVHPIHIKGGDAFCKGESLHYREEKDVYSVQGENLSLHAFVHVELAFVL
jgi:hypothetical protein